MDRCGTEYTHPPALLFLNLKPLCLYDYTQAFHEEDATEDGEQQLLMDDDGTYTDDTSDGQRPRITHEHLSRESIVPKETYHCSYEGTEEHHQFLGMGNVHDVEIGGITYV